MKDADRVAYLRDLAERFFLSYDMVVAARGVFDSYRARDGSPQRAVADPSSPEPSSPVPALQSSPSPVQRRLSLTDDAEPTAPPTRTPAVATVVLGDDNNNAACLEAQTPDQSVPVGHRLEACASVPLTYTVPWEGHERIGVMALEAALTHMGCPLPRLEVADLIDAVHGNVPLLATLYRAAHEEEAMAAQERQWQLQQQQQSQEAASRGGRRSRAGSMTSSRTATARSPREAKSSGRSKLSRSPSAVDGEATDPRAGRPAVRTQRAGQEDGLTFPEFLHVLQLPLVPEDQTPATREALLDAVFERVDADHDGVLSELDLVTTLRGLIYDEQVLANDPTVRQLAMMYPAELQTALAECDVDGDGIVTLRDVAAVLQ